MLFRSAETLFRDLSPPKLRLTKKRASQSDVQAVWSFVCRNPITSLNPELNEALVQETKSSISTHLPAKPGDEFPEAVLEGPNVATGSKDHHRMLYRPDSLLQLFANEQSDGLRGRLLMLISADNHAKHTSWTLHCAVGEIKRPPSFSSECV